MPYQLIDPATTGRPPASPYRGRVWAPQRYAVRSH